MNKLDFIIEWYYKENDRQISLNDSLNIPIGVLTGLFVIFYYMVSTFSFSEETHLFVTIPFIIFMIFGAVFSILVVFYLFKSYNNFTGHFEYKMLTYPTILNKHFENLQKYVVENKQLLDTETTAETLYEKDLYEMLSEYLNRNIDNNNRKTKFLYKAKKFLLYSVISVFLCAIPFYFNQTLNKKNIKPQQINTSVSDSCNTNQVTSKILKYE